MTRNTKTNFSEYIYMQDFVFGIHIYVDKKVVVFAPKKKVVVMNWVTCRRKMNWAT